MTKSIQALILVLVLFLSVVSTDVHPALAEDESFIQPLTLIVQYPYSITFRGRLLKPIAMKDLKLAYTIDRRECISQLGLAQPEVFLHSESQNGNIGDEVEWVWKLGSHRIIPGTKLSWVWVEQTASKLGAHSEVQSATVTDTRYTWYTTDFENTTVHMTYDNQTIASSIEYIAEKTIVYLHDYAKVPKHSEKYDIFIYPTDEEFQHADESPNSAGVMYARSNTIVSGFSALDWQSDDYTKATIAHEITHAVLAPHEFVCDHTIPDWFIEGYAKYVDAIVVPSGVPSSELPAYFEIINNSGVLPTNRWAQTAADVNGYYAQSKYIFQYLISTYGAEKPQAVRAALSNEVDFPTAFAQVYGFPVTELDKRFTDYLNRKMSWSAQIRPPQQKSEDQFQSKAVEVATIVPLALKSGDFYEETFVSLYAVYIVAVVVSLPIFAGVVIRKLRSRKSSIGHTQMTDTVEAETIDNDEGGK